VPDIVSLRIALLPPLFLLLQCCYLSVGLSMLMYGREEEADTLIEQLADDKDPLLRFGAMYTTAMAYCGTANNSAIRRLLHVAVSEVSDDVRRAAVISLGFLLVRSPEQCPKLVSLLAESYNPHVRYGACMALGISCAGTVLSSAIDLLMPLSNDPIDYVRQGALVALALVLVQATAAQDERVTAVRALFQEKIVDKHEELMCKFGSLLATGLIDAGGRNATVTCLTKNGMVNRTAAVGLLVFTQFWYWFPLVHFVHLAIVPTAFIGLNVALKIPRFRFRSDAPPSLFAYPPAVQPPTSKLAPAGPAAILSVTKKAKRKAAKTTTTAATLSTSTSTSSIASTASVTDAMEIDEGDKEKTNTKEEEKEEEKEKQETSGSKEDEKMKEVDEPEKAEDKKDKDNNTEAKEKEEAEVQFEVKQCPARVTPKQVSFLSFNEDQRYQPVCTTIGIVLLRDLRPTEAEEFVEVNAVGGVSGSEQQQATAPTGSTTAAAAAASTDGNDDGAEHEPSPPAAFDFDPTKE